MATPARACVARRTSSAGFRASTGTLTQPLTLTLTLALALTLTLTLD